MNYKIAARIAANLERHFPTDELPAAQFLCLAEEAGEAVGAYRRWSGRARRGDTHDHVMEELADVVIVAYVAAHYVGGDLDGAIDRKLGGVFSRGWREAS